MRQHGGVRLVGGGVDGEGQFRAGRQGLGGPVQFVRVGGDQAGGGAVREGGLQPVVAVAAVTAQRGGRPAQRVETGARGRMLRVGAQYGAVQVQGLALAAGEGGAGVPEEVGPLDLLGQHPGQQDGGLGVPGPRGERRPQPGLTGPVA
ncbi:hypothetical protein [Streptomyces sp. AA0539]|uniref:hypothetical protein n=1 Tax=Streptomyces sp. AA0539 TaxID=1210045 RepID=UPI00131A40A4|nr:hypothetical protein [Streptomyces sp. AA0539]